MKTCIKHTLAIIALLASSLVAEAQMKVGNAPTTINPGSLIEMESTNKGLLMPRISLTNTTTWGLTGTQAAGMHVYNTNASITSGTGTNSTLYPAYGIGEYYWDGFGWVCTNAVVPKTEWLQASGIPITIGNTTTNIPFSNTILSQNTPSGSISATSNTITLSPGRTYMLTFSHGQVGSSNTVAAVGAAQWYNNTTSGFEGTTGITWPAAGAVQAIGSPAVLVVRPTVTTTYSVRLSYVNGSLVYGNGGVAQLNQSVTVVTMP